MAGKMMNLCRYCWKYERANVIVGMMLLVLAGMMSVFFLTYEEEPQVVSAPVIVLNEGCKDMETNPLLENGNEEINHAVTKYYERLAENEEYVERYENMKLFVKNGQYEDTYVVYARYEMKIKDIYTLVPGLGTLYVEKNEKGKLMINAQVEDTETQQYIAEITQHEDVKILFQEVESAYAKAVQSDVMLAEAVSDLQSAAQMEENIE